jgi:hypothetical protein
MSTRPYTLVSVIDDEARYKDLIERWWNWVHTPNADAGATFPDVTFLRDDIIGNQRNIVAGFDRTNVPPLHKNITAPSGTNIFFPVYHVHYTKIDPYPFRDGTQCRTISRCVKAANNDLDNLYERWATINGQPITVNFRDFEIKVGPFSVAVPAGHGLNREEGFSLPAGNWEGVAHGTYLLLNNFQAGTYNIKFGGKATNYRTASEYRMTVRP